MTLLLPITSSLHVAQTQLMLNKRVGRRTAGENEGMRATGLQPVLYFPTQTWSLFFKVKHFALQSNRSQNAVAHKAGLLSLLRMLWSWPGFGLACFSKKKRPDLPPGLLTCSTAWFNGITSTSRSQTT